MIEIRLIPGNRTLIILPAEDAADIHEKTGMSVAALTGLDWNNDLSPWKAPRVFKKGDDFGEGAQGTLRVIEEWLKERDGEYDHVVIAGYSLAGLFALYAGACTDLFDGCISASGSLWFPDFIPWLEEHPLHCKAVYLSLGDQEKKTRNPVMAQVEDKTGEAFKVISSCADCTFEMNPGNHFQDPQGRLLKGIMWMNEHL